MDTKKIMAKVVRMLNRFEYLSLYACGHEVDLAKADRAREKLLEFILRTFEDIRKEGK